MNILSILPDEILLKIYLKLQIKDLIFLSQSCEYFHVNINDLVYWYWGKNKYSLEFWQRAFCRSPETSRPLLTMKDELIRIHLFQEELKKNGLQEWDNNDFYTYWYGCEKINHNRYIS
tara:strand:+ start:3481 stop:3834 length:354 start_codon:yes stop_codon:yes gene_type:complete